MRTLLVDAEAERMARIIREYHPNCQIVGIYADTATNLSDIQATEPEAAFVSLDMLSIDGFKLANDLLQKGCEVIMISEWTTFAYEALRSGVIDYLLKPFTPTAVQEAILRLSKRVNTKAIACPLIPEDKYQYLGLDDYNLPDYLTIHSQGSIIHIPMEHIIRCKAEKEHFHVVLKNNQKLNLICDTDFIKKKLLAHSFVQTSPHHIINLCKIDRFIFLKNTFLMHDGASVKVSKDFQKAVFQKLKELL